MVSYEMEIGLVILSVLLCVGSMNLTKIVRKRLVCHSIASHGGHFHDLSIG